MKPSINMKSEENITNKKTNKKEKKIENNFKENNKNIISSMNKNYLNKNNIQPNLDTKSTIIINNINNNKNGEINMNKVGLIQINNNQFENNNYYSNKDYNLKQNTNNILINNLNNNLPHINMNNNNNNNNILNFTNQSFNLINQPYNLNLIINPERINEECIQLKNFIEYVWSVILNVKKSLLYNNLENISLYYNQLKILLLNFVEIKNLCQEINFEINNSIFLIKLRLGVLQNFQQENLGNNIYNELFIVNKIENDLKNNENICKFIFEKIYISCNYLIHIIEISNTGAL